MNLKNKKAKNKLLEIAKLSLTMCTSDNINHNEARKINKLAREVYNIVGEANREPNKGGF